MRIPDIIRLMENKLTTLNNQRVQAENIGDLTLIVQIDADVINTQKTLDQLRSLPEEQE